jgi:hypothetical protein
LPAPRFVQYGQTLAEWSAGYSDQSCERHAERACYEMPSPAPHRIIFYIMLAVFVWGAVLALGAFLYGGARQALKADIILACVAIFLGIWALLLRRRAKRLENQTHEKEPKPHEA